MPARVIDYEALWSSEKLWKCPEWARVEYVWLYGLADCNGSFELSNMNAIRARVSAIRSHLTEAKLRKTFAIFEEFGLLFTWTAQGKRFGHWVGSECPGRLPVLAHRHRYKKLAPPVPNEDLAKYVSGYIRDTSGCIRDISRTGLGVGLGLDLDRDGRGLGFGVGVGVGGGEPQSPQVAASAALKSIGFSPSSLKSEIENPTTKTYCKDCGQSFPVAEFMNHRCPQSQDRLAARHRP